jgi:hypothetical protein
MWRVNVYDVLHRSRWSCMDEQGIIIGWGGRLMAGSKRNATIDL